MRKVLLMLLCVLFVFGCTQKTGNTVINSAELMKDINTSKVLSIQTVDEGGIVQQFKSADAKQIASLVQLVSNLELKQLSAKEENKLMKDGKALLSPLSYIASFYDQEQMELKGMIIGLDKDKLILIDPRTVHGANRAVSYLALNAEIEKINNLIDSIK